MKKIVIIALLIPYFLAVMSIVLVLFPGLTLKHLSTVEGIICLSSFIPSS